MNVPSHPSRPLITLTALLVTAGSALAATFRPSSDCTGPSGYAQIPHSRYRVGNTFAQRPRTGGRPRKPCQRRGLS